MTWSRALAELVVLGVGETAAVHRYRHFRFMLPRRELWDRLQPQLRTPVLKTVIVKAPGAAQALFVAGQSALAALTDLSEPATPERAVAAARYRLLAGDMTRTPWPEEGSLVLQVWRYDPGALADAGTVDPLSLYLSLREDRDDRVEQARDRLLEGVQW